MGSSTLLGDLMADNKALRELETDDIDFYNKSEPEASMTTGHFRESDDESENDNYDMGNESDGYYDKPAVIPDLHSFVKANHNGEQVAIFAMKDERQADVHVSSAEYYAGTIAQTIEDESGDNDNTADTNMGLDWNLEQTSQLHHIYEDMPQRILARHTNSVTQISGPDSPYPRSQTRPATFTTIDHYFNEGEIYYPAIFNDDASSSLPLIHRSANDATRLALPRTNRSTSADVLPSFKPTHLERLVPLPQADYHPEPTGHAEKIFSQAIVHHHAKDDAANDDICEEYRDHNGQVSLVLPAGHDTRHERIFNRLPESDRSEQSEETLKVSFPDHAQDEVSANNAPMEGEVGPVNFVSENSLRVNTLAQDQTAYYWKLLDDFRIVEAEEATKISVTNDCSKMLVDDHRRPINCHKSQLHETTHIVFADVSPAATPAMPIESHRWLRNNYRVQSHERPRIYFADDSAAVALTTQVDDHRWFGKHRRVQSEDIRKKDTAAHSTPDEGKASDVKKQWKRKRSRSMPHKIPHQKGDKKHGLFFKMGSFGRGFGHNVKHLREMTSAHFRHGTNSAANMEEQGLESKSPSTPKGSFPIFRDTPIKEHTLDPHTPPQHEPKSALFHRLRGRLSLSKFRSVHHYLEFSQLASLEEAQPSPFTLVQRRRHSSSPPLPENRQTSPFTLPQLCTGTPQFSQSIDYQLNQIRTPAPDRSHARQLNSSGRYFPHLLTSTPQVRFDAPLNTLPKGAFLMVPDAYNVPEYLPNLRHPETITRSVSLVDRYFEVQQKSGAEGFPSNTMSNELCDVPYEPSLKRSDLDKMYILIWERHSNAPLTPVPYLPMKKNRAESPVTPKRNSNPIVFLEPPNLARRHNNQPEWKPIFAPHAPSANKGRSMVSMMIYRHSNPGRYSPSFTIANDADVHGTVKYDSKFSNTSGIIPETFMAFTRERDGTLAKGFGHLLHHHNGSYTSPPKFSEHGRRHTASLATGKNGNRKRRVTFAPEPRSYTARKHNRYHAIPFFLHRVREASPTRGSFQSDKTEETGNLLRGDGQPKTKEVMHRNNLECGEKPQLWRERNSQINPYSFTDTVADPILPGVRHGVSDIRPNFMGQIRDQRLGRDRIKHNVTREACLNTGRMQDNVASHDHSDPEVAAARIGTQRRENPDVVKFELRIAANISQVKQRGGNDFLIASLKNSAAERRGVNFGSQTRSHPTPGGGIPIRMTRDRRDTELQRQRNAELVAMGAGPETLRRLQEQDRIHGSIMCYAQPHPDQFEGPGPFAQARRIQRNAGNQARRDTALHHLPNSAHGDPIGRQVSEGESKGYRKSILYLGQGHRPLHHMHSYSCPQDLEGSRVASQAAASHSPVSFAPGGTTGARQQIAPVLEFAGFSRPDAAEAES